MIKTIEERIAEIKVVPSNLEHIAKNGRINGSLHASIRDAMFEHTKEIWDLLREVAVRSQITFPETSEEIRWFDEAFKGQTMLIERIDKALKSVSEYSGTPASSLAQEAEGKWIDISVAVPAKYGEYRVIDPNSFVPNEKVTARWGYGQNWFYNDDVIHPTHWQPLPFPPSSNKIN